MSEVVIPVLFTGSGDAKLNSLVSDNETRLDGQVDATADSWVPQNN